MFEFYREVARHLPVADIFEEAGVEVIPSIYAAAESYGPVEEQTFLYFEKMILDTVRANPDLDGIWMFCHGAMNVQNIGSGEYRLACDLRALVGENCVISFGMDLHGNLEEDLANQVNIFRCYHTAPPHRPARHLPAHGPRAGGIPAARSPPAPAAAQAAHDLSRRDGSHHGGAVQKHHRLYGRAGAQAGGAVRQLLYRFCLDRRGGAPLPPWRWCPPRRSMNSSAHSWRTTWRRGSCPPAEFGFEMTALPPRETALASLTSCRPPAA